LSGAVCGSGKGLKSLARQSRNSRRSTSGFLNRPQPQRNPRPAEPEEPAGDDAFSNPFKNSFGCSSRGNEAQISLGRREKIRASYSGNGIGETLALTPALSPR